MDDTLETTQTAAAANPARAWMLVAAGWLAPGAGHFAQKRWGRGAVLAACVLAMFALGLAMHGKLYRLNPADIVDTAAWLANLGAGGLYFVARVLGYQVPEPSSASADYGTKFLLTAGLLNMLVLLDAWDLATGKKK